MTTSARDQDLPRFLRIATEVRLTILQMCIGEHIFHIFNTYGVDEESRPAPILHSLIHRECGAINVHRLPGLTATCRQLFAEANPILYKNTTMVFSCVQSMYDFFQNNTMALGSVQRLVVHCGPAKHMSKSEKSRHRRAFAMLQQRASNLRELHISLRTYYKIHSDRYILSNFWFHRLISLRGLLKEFSLHIDSRMAGPINIVSSTESTHLRERLLCTDKVLMDSLTKENGENITKKTVEDLKKEILAMIRFIVIAREGTSIGVSGYIH